MPRLADLAGLAGAIVAIAAVVSWLARAAGLRGGRLAALLGAAALVALVPVGGLPLAGYLRGVVGDLSVTTLVVLLRGMLRPQPQGPFDARNTIGLQLFVATAGLALYPFALGLGPFDSYRLGYGPWALGVLFAVAVAAIFLDLPLVTSCVGLGVLAWVVGAYESRNLWDYTLDPLVWAWSLAMVCLGAARSLRALRQARARPFDRPR
ncbi:MAG TPA: hypothetical protein VI669_17055 [Vicinamibacteria bacterium]